MTLETRCPQINMNVYVYVHIFKYINTHYKLILHDVVGVYDYHYWKIWHLIILIILSWSCLRSNARTRKNSLIFPQSTSPQCEKDPLYTQRKGASLFSKIEGSQEESEWAGLARLTLVTPLSSYPLWSYHIFPWFSTLSNLV